MTGSSVTDASLAANVTPRPSLLSSWIRIARPHQWIKNTFVIAPAVFGGRILEPASALKAGAAAVVFAIIAVGVYAANDAVDAPADRASPSKRHRPVAAGHIAPRHAVVGGVICMLVGLALGAAIDIRLALVGGIYVLLNGAYTLRLKHVVIADVFCIAAFFVLRLLAGSVAVDVVPSVWLLLCGGLLALYLGMTKRRCELTETPDQSHAQRAVLEHYDVAFLDQSAVVVVSVTVVAYVMYTLTSETALALGSEALAYSSFIVLYGLLRFHYLVHRAGQSDPARIIVGDTQLLLVGLGWMAYCGAVVYGLI